MFVGEPTLGWFWFVENGWYFLFANRQKPCRHITTCTHRSSRNSKKIGRYFKTAWRKRCLTLCDGFGVHPSFRQNMFLAVGSQTWTMSTKNSWFYSSKLGIKASTMSWKQKDLQIDVISRYVLYVGISLAKEWVGYLHPINQKLAMYIYHM